MEIVFVSDEHAHHVEALRGNAGVSESGDRAVVLEPEAYPAALRLLRRAASRGWTVLVVRHDGLDLEGKVIRVSPDAVQILRQGPDRFWGAPTDVRPGAIKQIRIC